MILLSNGGSNSHISSAPSAEMLVGTVDGVAVLEKAADCWQVAHKGLAGCQVSALAQAADGTVIAATHGVGMARSRDGGRSWQWINAGLDRYDMWSARCGRLQGREVILAGALPAHLFISEDGGDSWRELSALRQVAGVEQWCFPPPPRVGHVKDIVIDGDRLYVGIEIGALLVSDDAGRSFRDLKLDPVIGECDVHRILVHPERPGRILVANGLVGMLVSRDDGGSWTRTPMPPDANYPDPVVIHPADPDVLFLTAGVGWPPHWYRLGRARGKMFRSRDAGQTWERLLGGLPNGQRATFGALTIEAWPGGSGLYAADTDGCVFESVDGGDSWTIVADVAPVSKGDFFRGLVNDRVALANVDDIAFNPQAAARIAATKV